MKTKDTISNWRSGKKRISLSNKMLSKYPPDRKKLPAKLNIRLSDSPIYGEINSK